MMGSNFLHVGWSLVISGFGALHQDRALAFSLNPRQKPLCIFQSGLVNHRVTNAPFACLGKCRTTDAGLLQRFSGLKLKKGFNPCVFSILLSFSICPWLERCVVASPLNVTLTQALRAL
ncbi:hypothetical protein PoB_002524000 [Plakobranchus ocellatus]|uniref:Secreted protein n=1 Tax=Plakobranchus ocellatus TaxID=259542 RepID=A0AAV3ZSF5_9GAST|nr:hypothetical protein PoB_002524000 [Plakobranchus ocellatus]